jgi:HK97 family phage prohead protease
MADGTAPDLVRRSDALHVRAIRDDAREVDFVASTETIDSWDEIIDVASWKLGRFLANPVILYGHQSYELPIGQATRCEIVKDELQCTIRFASADANPEAEKVWKLVQEKVLRAVSVGFKPTDGKYEMRDGRDVYVLYGADLREISVVAIPANPDCLAVMKSAALEKADPATRERIRSATAARGIARSTADGSILSKTIPEPSAPSTATKQSAKPGATETTMNEAEVKALQEKTALAVATAQLAEKTATEARLKAESDLRAGEAQMKTLATEKAALEAQTKSLADARDAEKVRADAAEGQLIELEVDSNVGPDKKIAPAEKEMFVELRKTNPELFKKMLAQRSPMTLGKPVVPAPTEENGGATKAIAASVDDVEAEIEKLAG